MKIPYIIAEAGSTHEGSLDYAKELIQIAADADCQAVKFQFWSSPERMRERRRVQPPGYESGSIQSEWFPILQREAHDRGLNFMCSVYLPEDVMLVVNNVDAVKVSSFESLDKELCHQVNVLTPDTKPIFISTGMQDIWDKHLIKRAIRMHCVSAYPCPLDQANLGAIERGMGYSDHTQYVMTGALSVAAGANYLEIHFRRDETLKDCPDYPVSLPPKLLGQYVKMARVAASMRGDGRKAPPTR